ncbi:MAG TPA: ComEC/Rec2 family competence protein, partial [Gammaproteobacteria bacterium]|nr:ComEC/Rec2 family competence protein [Gammaproteobacteria bacterium]
RYLLELDEVDGKKVDGTVLLTTPPESVELTPGSTIEVFGRCRDGAPPEFPGQRSGEARLRARSVDGICRAVEPATVRHRGNGLASWLAARRTHVETRLQEILQRRAGVPIAMLTGTRSQVTDSERDAHRRAGTAHLLAISGLHFGALAAVAWLVCGWLTRRSSTLCRVVGARRASAGLVVATMAAYLVLVGAPVSAVRAFIAVSALAAAIVCEREPSTHVALGVAALAVLIWSPTQVQELGFQLSFIATLSIVAFWGHRPRWLAPERLSFETSTAVVRFRRLGSFVLMSWCATASTAPLLFAAFGEWSWAAFVTNLWAVPLVTLFVFPGLLLGVATMDALPWFGEPLLRAVTEVMFQLTLSVEWAGTLPHAVSTSGRPSHAVAWLVVAATMAAIVSRMRRESIVLWSLSVALMFASTPQMRRSGGWRFHFIPVGQGDATLIEAP